MSLRQLQVTQQLARQVSLRIATMNSQAPGRALILHYGEEVSRCST